HHAGCGIDDAAAQVFGVGCILLVIAQPLRIDAGFAHGHAAGLVDQGVPVVGAFTQAVVQHAGGAGNAFGFVAIGGLLAGNDDFPVLDGDFFHLEAGIVFQAI